MDFKTPDKIYLDALDYNAILDLCRKEPEQMAHIIQSMQKDLLAFKEERLTEKLIMAIHDAKKVMQPWNFSDATGWMGKGGWVCGVGAPTAEEVAEGI